MLQLLLIFCGTGFEVVTLVRIHNGLGWDTVYECSGGAFWASLHREYFPNKKSVPANQITQSISRNTIILNLNLHFLLTITVYYQLNPYICIRQ